MILDADYAAGYLAAIGNAVLKSEHIQKCLPKKYEEYTRLYSVISVDKRGLDGMRTVAISNFSRAKEMVTNNEMDISEGGSNGLCIIEAVMMDIPYGGFLNETYWYLYKGDGKYVPIECPKQYAGLCSFGVG